MIYRAVPRRYRTSDGVRYTGYDVIGQEDGLDTLRVEDVTEDARFARLLCAALNREQAEPVHVLDIISDFLADSQWKNSLLSP